MDSLTYRLISDAYKKHELYGISTDVLFTVVVTVSVSIVTLLFSIGYNNFRENSRIAKKLQNREDYFLWLIDYLIRVIPIQIDDYTRLIGMLKEHKIKSFKFGGNAPFHPKLLDIIHDQEVYDALIKRRKVAIQDSKLFYGLLQIHLSNIATIKEGSIGDYMKFESLRNITLERISERYTDIQLYHDELTKELPKEKTEQYKKMDMVFKSWKEDHTLEDDLSTFIKPLFDIGIEFSDLRLIENSREAKFEVEGLIILLDDAVVQFTSFCERLEDARTFFEHDIPSFIAKPLRKESLKKWL